MSVISPAAHRPRARHAARYSGDGAALRLARRQIADHRRRTLAFGALFAAVAYVQPAAYRHAYPTLASRRSFAHSFGNDKAIRLFYGIPHDLLTVGGYTAWRVGAVLAVAGGIWAVLAATGALRGEEDALRAETVLALPITRGGVLRATLAALAVQAALILVLLWVALVAGGLAAQPSAFLTITVGSMIVVFAGVGALASQLMTTRRRATELAAGCLALAFAVRVLADTAAGVSWLRWLSPLGWVEEMRPFAHPAPAVLAIPALSGAALIAASLAIARRRDVGTAVWQAHDARAPRRTGLRTPEGFALRSEATALLWWLTGTGAFALLIGMVSKSVSTAAVSPALRRELARVGAGSVATPAGYLGFTFLIFVFVLSLFACSQVSAARAEELEGRLDTMLAATLGRGRWLLGRLLVGAAGLGVLSAAAALLAWSGARAAGADVSASGMLLAATNCAGVGVLFLGLGALAYALLPRAGAALIYGLVTVLFLWQLFATTLGAPAWLINVSPFAHLGLAPAHPFRLAPVAAMVAIGLAAAAAAVPALVRRDLASGA